MNPQPQRPRALSLNSIPPLSTFLGRVHEDGLVLSPEAKHLIQTKLGARTVADLMEAGVKDFERIGILTCPARKLQRLAEEAISEAPGTLSSGF